MPDTMSPREKDVQERVEKIVFEKFYGGPLSGSTGRLASALIAEFNLAALASSGDHSGDATNMIPGDHAGLKRLADEAADFGVSAKVDPAVLNALIADVAALRARLETARFARIEHNRQFEEMRTRATEAERKLAEAEEENGDMKDRLSFASQLLRDYVVLTGEGHDVSVLNSETRTFLSKEAERG